MMDGLRRAGNTVVGRIVVAILFGFLILSFAVWGIADMIRNVGQVSVAKVGSAEISQQAFRDAYQTELQSLSRRVRRAITNDEARALGLERQVLSRMISEAALDQRVKELRLAMSDDAIVKAITADPAFQSGGQFDRNRFNELIRSSGFTEQGFVRQQRSVYLRQQLAEAVAGTMPSPAILRDAVHRYQSETRSAEYIVLTAAQAGEIPAPDAAALKTFFDQRKAAFRAPEYRKVNLLVATPTDVAQGMVISDADAQATYEREKARFGQPERRVVQQIVFPTLDEAKAAAERIKGGATFEAVAEERKLAAKDTDLGLVTKDAIIDPAVGEAAFSLAANTTSDAIAGRFGGVIVKVGEVQPAAQKPFAEVATQIKTEIALARARQALQDLHDRIEDQRASARPLTDIAKDQKLNLRVIDGIDRAGRDKAERPVDLPDREALLRAIFGSDIGVDNEALGMRDGGWIWFEVAGIDPARDRTLDEVKDAVAAQWKEDEISGRLATKANEIVKSVDGGATLASVASGLGLEVKTATGVRRTGADGGLSQAAVAQLFGTRVGSAAAALGATPMERVVLKVTGAEVPPLLSTQQDAVRLDDQIRVALGDDVLTAYVNRLQTDLGVTINERALSQAVGGGS
ncbi:SurA N-terminal domain-containing protein [Alsobacter sp. R-9]